MCSILLLRLALGTPLLVGLDAAKVSHISYFCEFSIRTTSHTALINTRGSKSCYPVALVS